MHRMILQSTNVLAVLLATTVFILGAGFVHAQSHAEMDGVEGIHIMPNGEVMDGTGEWVEDATITEDGMIELGSGEIVEPLMDMRAGEGIGRNGETMVVNENRDRLPVGCERIAGEEHITVTAGVENASDFPGTVFTYDQNSIDVEPCTRLTVTFVNKDHVRHQFMVHDLPRDTYTMGMFNIEVTGPGEATGTFITPADRETLMVHCGVPGHEEKGMKAQVKVGGGEGDLSGIPGITRGVVNATPAQKTLALGGLGGVAFGVLVYLATRGRRRGSV